MNNNGVFESISAHMMEVGDWIKRGTIIHPFSTQEIRRINRDDKNRVYFVYTDEIGWYYTIGFDEFVEIRKARLKRLW